MPKKGETITDEKVLQRLAEARVKANEKRKQLAEERKQAKLLADIERHKKAQAVKKKLDKTVVPLKEETDWAVEEQSEPEEEPQEEVVVRKPKPKAKPKPKPKPKKKIVYVTDSEESESEQEEEVVYVKKKRAPVKRVPVERRVPAPAPAPAQTGQPSYGYVDVPAYKKLFG